jgi:hypothetical protein
LRVASGQERHASGENDCLLLERGSRLRVCQRRRKQDDRCANERCSSSELSSLSEANWLTTPLLLSKLLLVLVAYAG